MSDTIILTENELALIGWLLVKHAALIEAGTLPAIENIYYKDFDCLISKVDKLQKIAWLKEQRGRI
jgi:hypothetical protein